MIFENLIMKAPLLDQEIPHFVRNDKLYFFVRGRSGALQANEKLK